jgi:hypothetical protein
MKMKKATLGASILFIVFAIIAGLQLQWIITLVCLSFGVLLFLLAK